jgi:X-X-X-Leu-X-X-Gly heptad repeat protein
MLKMMGEINGRLASGVTRLVDGINALEDKMTQTINSQSEPIVKEETYEEEPSPIYWLPEQYQAEPLPQKNFNVAESITKIEAHLEKGINHPNREDGELKGQPVANPDDHYMVDERTSCQKQAITTLRSGEVVKNHGEERKEERKEEQIEAPLDLY